MRILLVSCAVLLAGGCTPGAPAEANANHIEADGVSDVLRSDETGLIEYAINKLRADCMERQGYPQINQAGVKEYPGVGAHLNVKAPAFATVSEDEARRLGFGKSAPAEKPRVLSRDDGFERARESCRVEADNQLGPETRKIQDEVYELANTMSAERGNALLTDEEREVTRQNVTPVVDCLEAKGFRYAGTGERNLDAYGVGMAKGKLEGPEPPRPNPVPGKVIIVPEVPERRYVPTSDESALAVAAAQCSRQTGFPEKVVAQELRIIRGIISKHEAELAELGPKIEALAKEAAKLVGR